MDAGQLIGVAAAIAVCVGGVWWLWRHATRHRYGADDLITVAEFYDPTEANICKIRLESQGVQCCLMGDNTVLMNPLRARTQSNVIRLQVLGRDIGRAKQAIGRR